MAAALEQVKRRLGRDAVILNTRAFTKGGLFGWRGRSVVEITAAHQVDDLIRPRRSGRTPSELNAGVGPAEGRSASGTTAGATGLVGDASTLTAELASIKSLVRDLARQSRRNHQGGLPDQLFETYLRLVENQVSEELAQQLVARIREELSAAELAVPDTVRRRLAAALEAMLPTAGPIQPPVLPGPAIIALVGPTGVGKTTTIAKLAANFRLRDNREVGLITIDGYRIAAVEQLRTYAQIINVPLEAVTSPAQMRPALDRLSGCQVVLIDTAGRSQHDTLRINELKCFLDQAKPHEVHLVIAGTSSQRVVDEVLERFAPLGIDRVIFTKLDEAVGFGVILNSLHKAGGRLSYLTTGQDVPDDIEVGQASRVARLILGQQLRGETD